MSEDTAPEQRRKQPRKRNRTIDIICWVLVAGLSLTMLGGVFAAAVYYHYSHDLPDYSQLANYQPPIVTRIYAEDGRFMAEYATEKRIYVPLNAIPRRVVQAFLSAEDRNFYQHKGIDIYGVARAIRENILNVGQGHGLVGGSTITQQVVKNFLLTNEQSVERKVKEAILAFRISEAYSKDRILELYLNQIFLGQRSYGVAAASLNYFNKPLNELSIEESALLAAMPKAPSSYSPTRDPARAKSRRDWVISRMQQDGFITSAEASDAVAKPILLRTRDTTETVHADFFTEEVRRTLAAMYGRDVLYQGGLSVRTTLNPQYQQFADKALRKGLIDYDRRHGWHGVLGHVQNLADWKHEFPTLAATLSVPQFDAQALAVVVKTANDSVEIGLVDGSIASIALSEMKWARKRIDTETMGAAVVKASDVVKAGDVILVSPVVTEEKEKKDAAIRRAYRLEQVPDVNGAMVVMDPHNGKVLAMSGGYSGLNTDFNRATQAKRQPGSAFKPFVYLTALENGFLPNSIIVDAPVELSQGSGLPNWKPQNYHDDYLGPTTLRVGVEKSRNAMTVRLSIVLGIDKILATGKRFGIYDAPPRNFSIVLGAAETTLLRLTNAYASLANGGFKIIPTMIERIDDRTGKTVFRRDGRECKGCIAAQGETISDSSPPLPADARERVLDPRVAYQITSILEGVVQRGTAIKAKVLGRPIAGKTGTTNDSRDTWFVGYTPDLVVGTYIGFDTPKPMGKKETGGGVALPAFIAFMQDALKDTPIKYFKQPEGIRLVKLDLHSGQPVSQSVEGAGVVYEAFLVGEPPFVPGRKLTDAPVTPPAPIVEEPQEALPPPPLNENEDYSDRPWLLPQNGRSQTRNNAPQDNGQGYQPPGHYSTRTTIRHVPEENVQGFDEAPPGYRSRYPVGEPTRSQSAQTGAPIGAMPRSVPAENGGMHYLTPPPNAVREPQAPRGVY